MPILPLLLSVVAAAAQSPTPPASAAAPYHRFSRLFISPMGEPFRPSVRGGDALADWFAQADRNHDGYVTADEMQADADRFFAVLDTNHDGEIDPDEITHYEDVIAPEIRSGPAADFIAAQPGDGQARGGGHRGGRGGGGRSGGKSQVQRNDPWAGREDAPQGAERYGLLDLPEPVVAADADFNRGVSLEEFRKAAAQRFAALDVNHEGRLTLAVLETLRPAPPPKPNPPANDGSAG